MKTARLQLTHKYKGEVNLLITLQMSSLPPTKKARKVAPKVQEGIYKESKTSRGTRTRNVGVGKPTPTAGPSIRRPVPQDVHMEDAIPLPDPFEPDRRFVPTLDEIRARYGKVMGSRMQDE